MGAVGVGLGAPGIGGFAPTFGAPGLAATTGGLGFEATGGGGLETNELDGRELSGELSEFDIVAFVFHGAAVPFPAAIPGNTDTGLAEESAVIDTGAILGAGAFLGGGGGAGGAAA